MPVRQGIKKMFGKIIYRLSGFILASLLLAPTVQALAAEPTQDNRLVMGLVPNLSARALITAFEPMKASLEKQLGRSVELYTAPNFRTFHERTLQGEFDIVVTPAHFAWIAVQDGKYVPLTTYQNPLQGLIVVKQGSQIATANALRGKKMGITDPLAIVTMRGLQWLKEHGLQAGVDFSVHKSSPHNTAALAVGSGELDAAIIGSGPYRIMPEDIRAQIHVLSEVGAVPNATYLANGKLPPKTRKALQLALLAFGNESPEGKQFMTQYKYGGFKAITEADLRPMEIYSQQVKELLSEPAN